MKERVPAKRTGEQRRLRIEGGEVVVEEAFVERQAERVLEQAGKQRRLCAWGDKVVEEQGFVEGWVKRFSSVIVLV